MPSATSSPRIGTSRALMAASRSTTSAASDPITMFMLALRTIASKSVPMSLQWAASTLDLCPNSSAV
ncbi:Uncharacterised protein [Mycobacteroides abscessus subsp. abscessus]|nr:Uncharacterised protein [Mycobacteroides abscessus subsp. abscessus]